MTIYCVKNIQYILALIDLDRTINCLGKPEARVETHATHHKKNCPTDDRHISEVNDGRYRKFLCLQLRIPPATVEKNVKCY
mmetsp:Transcript_1125/g.2467  ORF Transcript_1125/g.2467 Transcript_1125/m.2467 type:complete len:81 (+) Transcript_1125:86-328(+)